MAGNSNFLDSQRNKEDEFYTKLDMIENELKNYRPHFKDKVVFCNCDDPKESNFWKYFAMNFEFLGLKKLVATHYDANKPTYKLELTRDFNGDGTIDDKDIVETPLTQNGDFRSPECLEILKEADIVVTNPPFSLFKEYFNTLIKYDKKFLIIGRGSAAALKDMFPLIYDKKVWMGKTAGHFWFSVPAYYEEKKTDFKIDENGQKWRRMGNICWYTNMDFPARYEDIPLYREYNPEDYPHYDNYDAIEVNNVADLPMDYDGICGVPFTFLPKWNPNQFEIIGKSDRLNSSGIRTKKYTIDDAKNYNDLNVGCVLKNNGKYKSLTSRLFIRRIHHDEN